MMSATRWVVFALLVALAGAAAVWVYVRREPPGPRRLLLAALRAGALALVLLLLFDPLLPGARPRAGQRPYVLVDASASMALPAGPGSPDSRWHAALREVERRRGEVLLFGDQVRPGNPDSLRSLVPADRRSRLLPALRAAAEAGAARIVVITDGELENAAAIPGWLVRLGLAADWVRVGEPLGGLSIPAVAAPPWAEAGAPVELRATVAAAGAPVADTVTLVVRQAGRVLAQRAIASPPPGRSIDVTMPVHPVAPAGGGFVRLEVVLEPGDAVPDDDRRVVSLFVTAEPAGAVVVSLAPDQEPRFLLPVLARALGVPVRGFLRTATGWVRLGTGPDAGQRVAEADVAGAAARAELLVVQAPGEARPAWLANALGSRASLLVLAPAAGADLSIPVRTSSAEDADWYLAGRVPPSPVAAQLAGAAVADLPPLTMLRTAVAAEGAWAPLLVTRGRSGEGRPLLVAGETDGRRWAVALGEGYWRWAFQGGGARALYERLWSAVAGWLLGGGAAGGGNVRPVERVLERGEPGRWLAPGLSLDSLRLTLAGGPGAPPLDTVLRAGAGDTLEAPVVPPGEYRYTARGHSGSRVVDGSGELVVESWTPELARPPADPASLRSVERVGAEQPRRAAGRPLHASPWPYLLVVLLLSAEWVLRRRWGLR